jgi:hypothetical protein
MPTLIVCFVIAWVIMKGCQRVATNTRGEVAKWWTRAEASARRWRHQRTLGAKLGGVTAGVALAAGRIAYRTARFGIRSFAQGVHEGWATRDRAAAFADQCYRSAWAVVRGWIRRPRRKRRVTVEPDPTPHTDHAPTAEEPVADSPEPDPDPKPEPEPHNPLIVIDGECKPGDPTDNDQAESAVGADLIVDFIQPERSEVDDLRPAAAPASNPTGGFMTNPQPAVGVGEITGIESTRIQLAAVSRVLSAATEALEHMQAGLAEYEVDQQTIGEVAQLVDQVQAASSAATSAVTNLNARHGGVEDAVKSAPVRVAQTRYYEE